MLAGLAVVLAGVGLIAIGAVLDWGWTRLPGAGLISVASVLIGALAGWSAPIRPRIAAIFASWSRVLIALLALVMVAPLILALVTLFVGTIVSGSETSWSLLLAGLAITIVLLSITLATVAIALQLTYRGLWRTSSPDSSESNGRDSE
jgi:hypothetical protein